MKSKYKIQMQLKEDKQQFQLCKTVRRKHKKWILT